MSVAIIVAALACQAKSPPASGGDSGLVSALLPSWIYPIDWKQDTFCLEVRPVPSTWKPEPPTQGVPASGSQVFDVIDSVPKLRSPRVALRLTEQPRANPNEPSEPLPLTAGHRYLVLITRNRGQDWVATVPEAPRAFLSYEPLRLAEGTDPRRVFFRSLIGAVTHEKADEAADAYKWLGCYYRSVVERKHEPSLGAYLTDVSHDADETSIGQSLTSAAARVDPISKVYLTYLAAIWGDGVGFDPFFAASRAARRANLEIQGPLLQGMVDAGRFPVLSGHDALALAKEFRTSPLFLFYLNFGRTDMAKEDMKQLYLMTAGRPEPERFTLYQFLAGRMDPDHAKYAPEGCYPVWRLGHIQGEEGIREKMDDFFGIPRKIKP